MKPDPELEALLLRACKALDRGVVGVTPTRAQAFGVPMGHLVQQGGMIPGSSRKAKTSGYYCPYSVRRPPSSECLMLTVDDRKWESPHAVASYELVTLCEENTGHGNVGGHHGGFTLEEMKAFLRGLAAGAYIKGGK